MGTSVLSAILGSYSIIFDHFVAYFNLFITIVQVYFFNLSYNVEVASASCHAAFTCLRCQLNILWRIDPLLGGDSVNIGRC
jgi:hypothetical protein